MVNNLRKGKAVKINLIQIEVKPFDESIKEAIKVFKDISKGKPVKKTRKIVFEDIKTLRSIITPERIKLLHFIRTKHPESIYELAKITDRKWRAVANDIELLNNVGLVTLEKKEKPREIVKPLVSFNKMNIGVMI